MTEFVYFVCFIYLFFFYYEEKQNWCDWCWVSVLWSRWRGRERESKGDVFFKQPIVFFLLLYIRKPKPVIRVLVF